MKTEMKAPPKRYFPYIIFGAAELIVLLLFVVPMTSLEQHILVFFTGTLAVVTAFYAWQTKQQAHANLEMAKEMKDARLAAQRPIVNIRSMGSTSKEVTAKFQNIGTGPALNIRRYLTHPRLHFTFTHDRHTVMKVGDEEGQINFPVEGFDGQDWLGFAINCDYEDVYKQRFRSILRSDRKEQGHFVFEVSELK